MAHPIPDLLALIALGEDVDGEAVQHVGECRACFAEIEALQQVVVVGRSLGPEDHLVAPHPRVWQHIAVEVNGGRVTPLPAPVGLLERPATVASGPVPLRLRDTIPDEAVPGLRPHPRRRWATVALAAAAALVVGVGGGFLLRGLTGSGADVVGVTQLNALPSWPGANGTASVENNADGTRTLVVTMDLPSSTAVDGTLAVWMSDTRAKDMVAMGTMTGATARLPIPAGVDIAAHPIVDVSLEPRGDGDPSHSDISVVRGRLHV